jgi:hypothetical protein
VHRIVWPIGRPNRERAVRRPRRPGQRDAYSYRYALDPRFTEQFNTSTVPYTLSLERVGVPPSPTAVPIAFGQSVTDEINPAGDVDMRRHVERLAGSVRPSVACCGDRFSHRKGARVKGTARRGEIQGVSYAAAPTCWLRLRLSDL